MKIIKVDEKKIKGINVRTKNANEMNPETSRIGGLWQKFYANIAPNLKDGATVFGVYYDYESDASGEFSVLAGSDKIEGSLTKNLEKISIHNGNYMLFEAKGDMPQVVIDTWSKIWDFFSSSSDDAEYQRAYTTDFELYKSQNEIEIYIAVK